MGVVGDAEEMAGRLRRRPRAGVGQLFVENRPLDKEAMEKDDQVVMGHAFDRLIERMEALEALDLDVRRRGERRSGHGIARFVRHFPLLLPLTLRRGFLSCLLETSHEFYPVFVTKLRKEALSERKRVAFGLPRAAVQGGPRHFQKSFVTLPSIDDARFSVKSNMFLVQSLKMRAHFPVQNLGRPRGFALGQATREKVLACPITPGLYVLHYPDNPSRLVSSNAATEQDLSRYDAEKLPQGDSRCALDRDQIITYTCPVAPGKFALTNVLTGKRMSDESPGTPQDNQVCPGYSDRRPPALSALPACPEAGQRAPQACVYISGAEQVVRLPDGTTMSPIEYERYQAEGLRWPETAFSIGLPSSPLPPPPSPAAQESVDDIPIPQTGARWVPEKAVPRRSASALTELAVAGGIFAAGAIAIALLG